MFGPVDRLEPDEASNDRILEVGVLDGVRLALPSNTCTERNAVEWAYRGIRKRKPSRQEAPLSFVASRPARRVLIFGCISGYIWQSDYRGWPGGRVGGRKWR